MMGSAARESDLIQLLDAIYEAAFEPARWDAVLQHAAELHGAHAGKVGSVDFSSGQGTTWALRGVDPVLHRQWEAEHSLEDVWAQAGLASLAKDPTHRTATGCELVPRDELRRTPVYGEVLQRCGIQDVVTTALAWSDSSVGWLALYRGPDQEPFDRRDRDLQDWIGRHARRAFALGGLLGQERGLRQGLLERLPCAAFVCGGDGRILLRNAHGEALLRLDAGLRARGERLCAQHARDQEALGRALGLATRSAAGEALAGGTTLQLRREVDRAPLAVRVDPLPSHGIATEGFGVFFPDPVAVVLVSDPESRTPLPEEVLAVAFGLTRAEAHLLAGLCAGETLHDHADRRRISRETVRSHLKQLFAKTGARRQAELLRMALDSVARLAARPPRDDAKRG